MTRRAPDGWPLVVAERPLRVRPDALRDRAFVAGALSAARWPVARLPRDAALDVDARARPDDRVDAFAGADPDRVFARARVDVGRFVGVGCALSSLLAASGE